MYGSLISSVTVGAGGAASISFTSIPGTYTDLTLVLSGRTSNSSAGDQLYWSLNGSTIGSNYLVRDLRADSGSVSSTTWTGTAIFNYGTIASGGATASVFGNAIITIPNYTSSVAKSVVVDGVSENNSTSSALGIYAGRWSGTSAITSITLTSNASFTQYSTAYLYGLLKGSGGATAA